MDYNSIELQYILNTGQTRMTVINASLLLALLLNAVGALRMNPLAGTVGFSTTPLASTGISWDSHKAVDEIPATLVSAIDGNQSMRRKFEKICREAQVKIILLELELTPADDVNREDQSADEMMC